MSNIKKKNGPHISERNETTTVGASPFEQSTFSLDKDLAKELESKGLVGRFVSVKKMEEMGGYHPAGWRPYKRENNSSSADWLFGKDPEGYTRRGDLVLAVKTKEDVSAHKQYLAQKAKSYSATQLTKHQRRQFKEFVDSAGMTDSVSVKDGYDEE